MGRDKALLPYRGVTLLEHALQTLRVVTADARILCGPTLRYRDFNVPVVIDEVCGAGPLGGLYAALVDARRSDRERLLWMATDLPLVSSSFLARLVDGLDHADVAMARTDGGFEPLCAAFNTEPTLLAVRRSLVAGRLKLTDAFDGLTLLAMPGEAAMFSNINSRAEYDNLS